MCAQKILKAAKIGTAKLMPTITHIQPQKVSESRMITGFRVRERPIIHGVMKLPSNTPNERYTAGKKKAYPRLSKLRAAPMVMQIMPVRAPKSGKIGRAHV